MELDEILDFIKVDFPDKSIDISESLGLLMDTIDDIMNLINIKIGKAYSDRDFNTVDRYTTLGKAINSYENKIDDIINFTRIEQPEIIEEENEEEAKIKNLPNYNEYIVDNRIEHTLYENFTHIRPFGFQINSEGIVEAKTWQEMFLKTCEIFITIDNEKFLSFENNKAMNGKKNKYFSINPDGIRKPENVAGKIFVETNMSGNSIRNLIVKILKEYRLKVNNYKVYFRADYTALNKE